MKRILTYLLIMLGMLVSCQGPELPLVLESGDVDGLVTIPFKVEIPSDGTDTKARGDAPHLDIKNLWVVVFDENGYFVEASEAVLAKEAVDPCPEHTNETAYKVTLHKTDKRRIIHFIANCPEDQIHYGHESEVIGNMYVTKGDPNESAYWYRMSVWYVMTEEEDGKEVLVDEIAEAFKCIPLLRNYARITVVNNIQDFQMESFAIYNTIDIGTVAPYNDQTHDFQRFVKDNGTLLTYDEHKAAKFEGHALMQAKLDGELDDADFVAPGDYVYMYERKISVRTQDEQKWSESPAHIIIKGTYQGKTSYYKVDMVRLVEGKNEYYNILRNFTYIFSINSITGKGYPTLKEAMDNPAGNNLSGASDTQGFTNVSDGLGRIFVSYTDTTLVTSSDVRLRYKYIPSVTENTVRNDKVSVSGIFDGTGSVIQGIKSINNDVGDGWAEVVFDVQEVGAINHIQEVLLNVSDNTNLHRTIRYRLQKPYEMDVQCRPGIVAPLIGRPMNVAILIPDNLPETIFPLDFQIEIDQLSLSPDAKKENNTMPVAPSLSIIPGKENKNSFHFVKTIETFEDYRNLVVSEGKMVIPTHWVTTKENSASSVYVRNKYFNLKSASFENGKAFTELAFPDGVKAEAASPTRFVFNMTSITPVTVSLVGLTNNSGEYTFTYVPSAIGMQELNLKTVNASGDVSVTLAAETYETISLTATQANTITIPQLTLTFRYTHSYSPAVDSVTPVITVDGGNVTNGDITRSRTGSSRNYTYTIVVKNVEINASNGMNANLTMQYNYNNGHGGNYTYRASAKVSDLVSHPYVTLTE